MKTITINTPDELLSKWQEVATRLGISLEELIVSSVEERLNKYSEIRSITGKTEQIKVVKRNDVIYADFSEMATDREYQEEALAICQEFEEADWEALQLGESEHETR